VHPKKLTGECGGNYMKELNAIRGQTKSFNYIPLLSFQDAHVKSVKDTNRPIVRNILWLDLFVSLSIGDPNHVVQIFWEKSASVTIEA